MSSKKKAPLLGLIAIIFFSVSGGPYGLEEIVSSIGPFNTLVLTLVLPIVWTIPETMIVAELSSTYPVQGGYYRWVEMSLGRFWGFLEGWWSLLYTLIDLALYPILFTMYLKFLLPNLDFITVYLIQLIMIWSCALINILGIRTVGSFLSIFQAFILISFAVFIVLGLRHIHFDFSSIHPSSKPLNINNWLFGLSLAFWNFIGWDNGSTVLHEVENPKINYHKALFISIPVIVIFYFFPVLIGACIHTDWQNWHFGEFSQIAKSMHYPILAVTLAIGGMVTCLGLFNSLLLSSTRVFMTMAEDKLLPKYFALLHKNFGTPYIAILFAAIVYSFLVLVEFKELVIYDVFLYLIAILLEAIALVVLRQKNPDIKTNFKIPFGKLGLGVIVTVACLVILFMVGINLFNLTGTPYGTYFSLFLMLNGIPIYLFYNTKNKS